MGSQQTRSFVHKVKRSKPLSALLLGVSLALVRPVAADEPLPLLAQLNHETQALHQSVQASVARVQLPQPRWVNDIANSDNPAQNWPQLTAEMRRSLELQQHTVRAVTATTQPGQLLQLASDGSLIIQPVTSSGPVEVHILSGGTLDAEGRPTRSTDPRVRFVPASGFAPNNVGLVIDTDGHLLVPLFVEKDVVGEGVKVSVGDGPVVNAAFVASDRPSMLSLFKLPTGTGKAVRVGPSRPADGSLVMLLAPNAGTSRLVLWAGDKADLTGVVVSVDGGVNGFARGNGQFLSVASYRGVVDELLKHGSVKRATLGLLVAQVATTDPARERWTALGSRPALRVGEVTPRSAADKAGLRKDDLILSLAGEAVGDPNDLASVLAGREGRTPINVLRDGALLELDVDLLP